MRRLHSVAKHEKFVASGVYTVFEKDEPTGVREHWSIHEVGDGAQFIRVDIDGRDADGRSILIEALRNPAGEFERIDQHIYEQANAKPYKLSHTFFADHVELAGVVDDRRLDDSVTMPPGYGMVLPAWLLAGFTIKQAAQQANQMTLLRVDLVDGQLDWSRVEAVAIAQGTETFTIAGHELAAQCYRWQTVSTACIDAYGVMLRAETPTGRVALTQYARRPELA